jgi:tRNA(Ile)-lysidine synthase
MPPVRRLNDAAKMPSGGALLIRPLIKTPRQEIFDYLASVDQEYRTDCSNQDATLLRNWIRLRLLPQLREKIDFRLDERVARLTDLLRGEEIVLERMTQERLGRMADGKKLRSGLLLQEDPSMQKRLIRRWFKMNLGDLRGIGFRHVEAALRFIIQGPPQGYLSLPRKRNLVKMYETVRLEKGRPKVRPVSYSYTLVPGEALDIPEAGVTIQSSRTAFTSGMSPQSDLEAYFDLAALPETLTVRNFRAGDRFRPLGMHGHKKI